MPPEIEQEGTTSLHIDLAMRKKLALSKHFVRQAKAELTKPVPFACTSLVLADSGLELFLMAALNKLVGFKKSRGGTGTCLDELSKKVPNLEVLRGAFELVECRNALKHTGTFENKENLNEVVAYGEQFIYSNCHSLFGFHLAEVSEADAVRDGYIRGYLQRIQGLDTVEERYLAERDLAGALAWLIHIARNKAATFRKPHKMTWMHRKHRSSLLLSSRDGSDRDARERIKALETEIDGVVDVLKTGFGQLEESLDLVAAGLDLPRFNRVRRLLPYAAINMRETVIIVEGIRETPQVLTADELRWCFDYILTTTLNLEFSAPQVQSRSPRPKLLPEWTPIAPD